MQPCVRSQHAVEGSVANISRHLRLQGEKPAVLQKRNFDEALNNICVDDALNEGAVAAPARKDWCAKARAERRNWNTSHGQIIGHSKNPLTVQILSGCLCDYSRVIGRRSVIAFVCDGVRLEIVRDEICHFWVI